MSSGEKYLISSYELSSGCEKRASSSRLGEWKVPLQSSTCHRVHRWSPRSQKVQRTLLQVLFNGQSRSHLLLGYVSRITCAAGIKVFFFSSRYSFTMCYYSNTTEWILNDIKHHNRSTSYPNTCF